MPGNWHTLTNSLSFGVGTMLQLTDGTIMVQEAGGKRWARLTPDIHGKFLNATVTLLSPMHHTRLYFASAVLKDGRVFVAGGEYSDAGSDTNTAEVYDPVLDMWTVIASPPGWLQVGDAVSCVLPDGNVMIGNLSDQRTAIYHPSTNTWTAGP